MLLSMAPPHTYGYSGGPLRNVTDLAPTCAGCHSSYSKDQLRNEPEAFANGQAKENKHYKAIEDGSGPYQQMSLADRQKLLADVKLMDELASVNLSAPASLRPGQEAQVTVEHLPGTADRPLSREERITKVSACFAAGGRPVRVQAERLVAAVGSLDRAPSPAGLWQAVAGYA